MKDKFIKALESNNLYAVRKIPKSDLHNHITRGGNKRYIEKWVDVSIPKCPKLKDLGEMNKWIAENIKPLCQGRLGYEKRIEAAFVQARMDGIKVLHMSVSIGEEQFYDNSVENLVQAVKRIHKNFAPEISFIPEIAFLSNVSPDEISEKLDEFLDQDYFKSIDMFGDEFVTHKFKKVYRKAKEKGLILKAHVGEFGTADLVKQAVEELELNQVQHGIAAANSKSIMKWLCDNKIQLNVCPTSNVLLSRVDDYKTHPIRKLYDNGVKVTINTDDMIIFDQSVSEEFLNLYNLRIFNAIELDEIRENGLALNNSDYALAIY